jgi:hypothetical protein
MPKNDPAGYLPAVKKARKRTKPNMGNIQAAAKREMAKKAQKY